MSRNRGLKNKFPGIVTGASSGIGKGLACLLARKHKARLVINARNLEQLESTAAEVRSHGGECLIVQGDIAQEVDRNLPRRVRGHRSAR